MELPGPDPKIHSKFTKEKTQQRFAIARLTIGEKLKNLVSKSDEKIDSFLRNKKLRDKTITAIIISHREDVLAFYFYDKYAYCNHDIGSNWDRKIVERLKKTTLPYSYVTHDSFEKRGVIFKTRNKETEIYKAIKEDIRIYDMIL